MGESPDILLQSLIQRILARVQPNERSSLRNLLTNVELFIKHTTGSLLTYQERIFPPHPLFSHLERIGGPEAANTLIRRLKLVDNYKVTDGQSIIGIMAEEYPVPPSERLTTKKARLLRVLYNNPLLPRYQLAKELSTTPRAINRELKDLQERFALQIYTALDPHRFKLAYYILSFRTKSIEDSQRLEKFFQNRQGFLRTYQLDRDSRRGFIAYRFPEQKNGHQMFNERVKWLHEEFFSESFVARVIGHHYYMSFSNYDPDRNLFLLEADIVSEAMLRFVKEYHSTIPSPQGFNYSNPINFDRADYLLALRLFSTGATESVEYKRALLKRFGIKMTKKTIWNRIHQLRQQQVAYPIIHLKIPGFDEQVALMIQCTPRTRETMMKLSSILPYSCLYTTDSGLILLFQRPIRCASITGQLIRAINRERGVKNIELLRYLWRISPPSVTNLVNQWDTKNQSWILQEGNI